MPIVAIDPQDKQAIADAERRAARRIRVLKAFQRNQKPPAGWQPTAHIRGVGYIAENGHQVVYGFEQLWVSASGNEKWVSLPFRDNTAEYMR